MSIQKKSLKLANGKKQKVQSGARKTQNKALLASKTISLRRTSAYPPDPC
jgi:hypothetical protein